jgi:hypothetical protein
MAAALIVGIPRDVANRLRAVLKKGEANYRDGWSVEYLPSPRVNTIEIRPTEVERAIQLAGELGGAHVLALSKQDGTTRKTIGEQIRPYFRFLWLKNALLAQAHRAPAMIAELNEVLAQEEVWSTSVRPSDITSALLLPKTCFSTHRPLSGVWEEAEESGNPQMCQAVGRRLQQFRDDHWLNHRGNGGRWVDGGQRVFDHTGERHGDAPSPRDYKYSYPIPSGFHYDVSHSGGREFRILDHDLHEERVRANSYINVDPHGHLRKAS